MNMLWNIAQLTLKIHKDAVRPGQKVLVIDDLLATGGTIKAANQLVEKLGSSGSVTFLIELVDLKGHLSVSRL